MWQSTIANAAVHQMRNKINWTPLMVINWRLYGSNRKKHERRHFMKMDWWMVNHVKSTPRQNFSIILLLPRVHMRSSPQYYRSHPKRLDTVGEQAPANPWKSILSPHFCSIHLRSALSCPFSALFVCTSPSHPFAESSFIYWFFCLAVWSERCRCWQKLWLLSWRACLC